MSEFRFLPADLRPEGSAFNSHVREGVEGNNKISSGPKGPTDFFHRTVVPHLRRSELLEGFDPRPHGRGY